MYDSIGSVYHIYPGASATLYHFSVGIYNRRARLIITGSGDQLAGVNTNRLLRLTPDIKDEWAALSEFLDLEYPAFTYPCSTDIGQRHVPPRADPETLHAVKLLRSDRSPWIVGNPKARWGGIRLAQDKTAGSEALITGWNAGHELKSIDWKLRDDTFPSNLVIFKPSNFINDACGTAELTLRKEKTSVRDFSSAAIASQQSYLYGTFSAIIRPPRVAGLITGVFLHRNGPRQEIDIEFLGRDTSKMLVNVYYNPGPEGTKLEYGYRGTPSSIDLGFDAADALHTYEIAWQPHSIIWRVDGKVVYERLLWNPTPIPDQPLEFNVNIWHSRSTELAGHIDISLLPAALELQSIAVHAEPHWS